MDPPTAPLAEAPIPVAAFTTTPAAVASAAPPKPPPAHPPYAKMIVSAMKILGENKGWSKTAIKKVISSTYTNLPPAHSALLSRHLRRLKKRGAVVMVKHSYMLPGVLPNAPEGGLVKRGRGRPPKRAAAPTTVGGGKRARGRPPKLGMPKPIPVGVGLGLGMGLLKRGRGRPRKGSEPKPKPDLKPIPVPISVSNFDPGSDTPKRRPGRPPKGTTPRSVPSGSGLVKRRPGRPPKETGPKAIVVAPNVGGAVEGASVSGQVKRRPGRPSKGNGPKPNVGLESGGVSGEAKRRPGRPPKETGPKPDVAVPSVAVEAEGGNVPKASPAPAEAASSGGGLSGRKRGRPRKSFDLNASIDFDLNANPISENGILAEGGDEAAAPQVGVSRGRGRPPKISSGGGEKIKKASTSGRPVGRPKKGGEVLKPSVIPAGEVLKPTVVPVGDV